MSTKKTKAIIDAIKDDLVVGNKCWYDIKIPTFKSPGEFLNVSMVVRSGLEMWAVQVVPRSGMGLIQAGYEMSRPEMAAFFERRIIVSVPPVVMEPAIQVMKHLYALKHGIGWMTFEPNGTLKNQVGPRPVTVNSTRKTVLQDWLDAKEAAESLQA